MSTTVTLDTYRVGIHSDYLDSRPDTFEVPVDFAADFEGYVFATPRAAVERFINTGNLVPSLDGTLEGSLNNTLALLADPTMSIKTGNGYVVDLPNEGMYESYPDTHVLAVRVIKGSTLDEGSGTTRNVVTVTRDFTSPAADLL